jgi:hypothetical protein
MTKCRNLQIRYWLCLVVAVAVGLALPAARADAAVVNAAPTWPISGAVGLGPPPIPSLPAATDAVPPADQITDPVRPAAVCGGWHQQSNYGDRWAATSTWWEYSCNETTVQSGPPCVGACDAFCPYCWTETTSWTDSFYWNGSDAVFYGQAYFDLFDEVLLEENGAPPNIVSFWWDGATSQWYDLAPAITSFTPPGGPSGTVVDIKGRNFNGAMSVTFGAGSDWGGAAALYTVDSDTEIHATVPPDAWIGSISVTTADGTALSASSFTVTASATSPAIASFTPTSGPLGASVDIQGWNFNGATSVAFNGTTAQYTIDSNSEIHATVPAGSTSGPISVTTPGGTYTSAVFWVTPPSVSSITPDTGPVGTRVDIRGSNLSGATSVSFNGKAALIYTVDSDSEIHATVPAGATSGPISVTRPGGTATSAVPFTVETGCPALCADVGSASILEGNTGTHTLKFQVTLSQPSPQPVTVRYAVTSGSATVEPNTGSGIDVVAKPAGSVQFNVGTNGLTPVSQTISVKVVGDPTIEPNETFTVRLTRATGATIGAHATAAGTVIDDDAAAGLSVGVGDSAIVEGNAGARSITLPVTLSDVPGSQMSVSYVVTADSATYASDATAGGDYGGMNSGRLRFMRGGSTTRTVSIPIWPDAVIEPDETFTVTLTSVSAGVSIARPTGTGTIINDD